jgi:hypothetical protein
MGSRNDRRRQDSAGSIALLAILAGIVAGILAIVFFGAGAHTSSLVPSGASASALAPAFAVGDAGIGVAGQIWNFFLFCLTAFLTGFVVAIVGLLSIKFAKGKKIE